jgi:hypothetical protein
MLIREVVAIQKEEADVSVAEVDVVRSMMSICSRYPNYR